MGELDSLREPQVVTGVVFGHFASSQRELSVEGAREGVVLRLKVRGMDGSLDKLLSPDEARSVGLALVSAAAAHDLMDGVTETLKEMKNDEH